MRAEFRPAPMTDSAWPTTLPGALANNARDFGSKVAMRERQLGIWREWSWTQLHDDVLALAAALSDLGVKRGSSITVIGDNRASLYMAMLAANVLGAFPAPVFADLPPEELAMYTEHGEPDIAVAEDQEQVDKLLRLRERTGRPRTIVYDDARGLRFYADKGLMSFQDLLEAGRSRLSDAPELRAKLANGAAGDDIAVLLHSSGTTGKPKGVAVRQRHVVAAVRAGADAGFFAYGAECFAYLPVAWIGDFVFSLAASILLRGIINIPERQETVLQDLRSIAPNLYLAAPRAWDNMLTRIQIAIADSTPVKRRLFDFFMNRATLIERQKLAGEPSKAVDRLWRLVGEIVIFGPIKDFIGLSRAHRAYTGGESLGEDTFLFFRALGINLKQFYGQTETCAITAAQPDGEVRLDTVGRPVPGTEIRIGDDGEILVRSPSVIDGYLDDPAATARTFVGGWLRTGDAGRLDESGHLVVLGRVSDVVRTAAGHQYIPNYIENRIKFTPFVRNVAIVGAGRSHLGAIVCIDFEAVGHWAEKRAVSYTGYADLSQKPEVYELIREVLADMNSRLPNEQSIRRFINLHKEFDADDGEITRTRKLRRNVIEERYGPLIDALYDGSSNLVFDAPIVYESGEIGNVRRDLTIMDVLQ